MAIWRAVSAEASRCCATASADGGSPCCSLSEAETTARLAAVENWRLPASAAARGARARIVSIGPSSCLGRVGPLNLLEGCRNKLPATNVTVPLDLKNKHPPGPAGPRRRGPLAPGPGRHGHTLALWATVTVTVAVASRSVYVTVTPP